MYFCLHRNKQLYDIMRRETHIPISKIRYVTCVWCMCLFNFIHMPVCHFCFMCVNELSTFLIYVGPEQMVESAQITL